MRSSSLFPRSRSFWFGLTLPIRAAKLILKKRKLLFWSILPITVTLVLYIYVIGALQMEAQHFLEGWFNRWGWSDWVIWIMTALANIMLWVISALTFAFTTSIIASPFNDILAEKAEAFSQPPLSPVQKMPLTYHIRLIGIDLFKTVAAACAGIAAIIFSLIPVLNFE